MSLCESVQAARAQTRSQPEGDGCCERYGREEAGGELVVPGGYAAEVLQTAEGVFDEVTTAVPLLVITDGSLSAATPGDDGVAPTSRSERRRLSAS